MNMITIAEVAAKLGMRELGFKSFQKDVPAGWMILHGSGPQKYSIHVRESRDGLDISHLSPREVCELAGVDYDRYEGREPEPVAPKPSSAQVLEALLSACKSVDETFEVWQGEGTLSETEQALHGVVRAAIALHNEWKKGTE